LPADDASSVTGMSIITASNQTASVNNRSTSDFVIYPNPVHSQPYIESDKKIKTLTILNVLGEIVATIDSLSNAISVSPLTQKICFLTIQSEDETVIKKSYNSKALRFSFIPKPSCIEFIKRGIIYLPTPIVDSLAKNENDVYCRFYSDEIVEDNNAESSAPFNITSP